MLRFRGPSNLGGWIRRPAATGRAATGALVAWLLALPAVSFGAAPWHDDLARAREASRASRRPVLALFVATWQPGVAAADMALGTPDARALVTSCFEPVIIDVDQHPDLTRRLGIKHVPTAALLDEHDAVLASFACPPTTPEFVVAAARAAQQATTARQERVEDESHRPTPALAAGDAASQAAVSTVTSKVRQLSDFATDGPLFGSASAMATAATYQQPAFSAGPDPRFGGGVAAVATPGAAAAVPADVAADAIPPAQPFPLKPPAWPAETPLAPLASAIADPAVPRPTLEPGPAGGQPAVVPAQPSTPWLAANATMAGAGQAIAPQASVAQATAPQAIPPQATVAQATVAQATDLESSASVSDLPATSPQPSAAMKKPSAGEQFLAALQKPFGGFGRKPAAGPSAGLPTVPAPPATVAPARPQWPSLPFAVAPSTTAQAAAPAASPVVPPAVAAVTQSSSSTESAGHTPESMPLGLEGYCPVTLAAKGVWTEGRAQYGVRHRGRTYLFAGAAEQQTFLADPDRYAPALSGDDPVVAMDHGRSLPGQRRYGVTCSSRMYLFSSPETRAAFQAHPERYTARIAQAEQPASAGTRTY